MEPFSYLESFIGELRKEGSVKSVYGEPITTQGKTIIPVAKITMGAGGGFGKKNGKEKNVPSANSDELMNDGAGGGVGGGLPATAEGVYEVTAKGTRFIPATQTRKLLALVAVSFLVGRWFGKHKARQKKMSN